MTQGSELYNSLNQTNNLILNNNNELHYPGNVVIQLNSLIPLCTIIVYLICISRRNAPNRKNLMHKNLLKIYHFIFQLEINFKIKFLKVKSF